MKSQYKGITSLSPIFTWTIFALTKKTQKLVLLFEICCLQLWRIPSIFGYSLRVKEVWWFKWGYLSIR